MCVHVCAHMVHTSKASRAPYVVVGTPICSVFVLLGPGSCEEAKLRVLRFIKDTEEMVLASNNSWFPLGESFLAAKGIQLTNEELGLPPLAPPRGAFLEQFLSGSDYALRLAAQSSECRALLVSRSISWGSKSWNSCS